jgi:hypothetical protein
MRRLEDEYSPEEIRRMREAMDQIRERQLETKQRAREAQTWPGPPLPQWGVKPTRLHLP